MWGTTSRAMPACNAIVRKTAISLPTAPVALTPSTTLCAQCVVNVRRVSISTSAARDTPQQPPTASEPAQAVPAAGLVITSPHCARDRLPLHPAAMNPALRAPVPRINSSVRAATARGRPTIRPAHHARPHALLVRAVRPPARRVWRAITDPEARASRVRAALVTSSQSTVTALERTTTLLAWPAATATRVNSFSHSAQAPPPRTPTAIAHA